jgi:LPXTG-motif cell wall-anchored protein
MPATGNSTYALVIISLGILGIIISFLVPNRKKYFIAMGLSLLVVAMGLFEFLSAGFARFRMARRINQLQETQRLNLETLQSRLREAAEKARKPGAVATPGAPIPTPVPAPARPAPRKR